MLSFNVFPINLTGKCVSFFLLSIAGVLQASAIDLLEVTAYSEREYTVNAGYDGSLNIQVALPFKDDERKKWYGDEQGLPKFRLGYHSHSSNGLLGRNWHLEFFSHISLCSSDQLGLDQSTNSNGLNAYCLDGSRLIAGNNGWYSTYRGMDGFRERVSVKAVGNCQGQPCQFIVAGQLGDVRVYGGSDLNVLNGDASLRTEQGTIVAWSLARLVRGNTAFEMDYHLNPISNTHLLKHAVSTSPGMDPLAYFFEYQDRLIPYTGSIDGIAMTLDNVLSAISIHDLATYNAGVHQHLALLLFNYHRNIEDKALRSIESCQWAKGFRNCGHLNLTYRYPGKSEYIEKDYSAEEFGNDYQDLVQADICEQRWHLPHGHFFHCGDILLNAVLLDEIALGGDVLMVEYRENNLAGAFRPWQLVSKLTKFIGTHELYENERVEYRFKWQDSERDDFDLWNGFKRRKVFVDSTDQDLTLSTIWTNFDGLKVVASTSIREGIAAPPDIIINPGFGTVQQRASRSRISMGDITWGDGRRWNNRVVLSCDYLANFGGLVNVKRRTRSYQRDNQEVCQQQDIYAQHFYFSGKNEIVGVGSAPENCRFSNPILALGKVDFNDLVNQDSDSAELGSYNESCDALSSYIFKVGKMPPSATTFPPFRPPGVPAPEIPEEKDSVGGEED